MRDLYQRGSLMSLRVDQRRCADLRVEAVASRSGRVVVLRVAPFLCRSSPDATYRSPHRSQNTTSPRIQQTSGGVHLELLHTRAVRTKPFARAVLPDVAATTSLTRDSESVLKQCRLNSRRRQRQLQDFAERRQERSEDEVTSKKSSTRLLATWRVAGR